MHEDGNNFEDALRAMAREFSQSVERAIAHLDIDGIAGMTGVDPERAREWAQGAGSWLRGQAEGFDPGGPSRAADAASAPGADRPSGKSSDPRDEHPPAERHTEPVRDVDDDFPAAAAAPHPLDLPTEEQGVALAALDSGRWTVEPGTQMLTARGQGPGPSDALGLVRELRVRDWISDEGEITRAGRRALDRWLDACAQAH